MILSYAHGERIRYTLGVVEFPFCLPILGLCVLCHSALRGAIDT